MKKILLPFVVFIAACSSEPQAENEPVPEVAADTLEQTNATDPVVEEDLMTRLDGFFEHLKQEYDAIDEGSCRILDEGTMTCSAFFKKKEGIDGSNIYPELNVSLYMFDNEQAAINKTVEFLSSFEHSGEEITIGQNIGALKSPPMHLLLSGTEAIVIQYPCEHIDNDWESVIDEVLEHFGQTHYWRGSMYQCGIDFEWMEVGKSN